MAVVVVVDVDRGGNQDSQARTLGNCRSFDDAWKGEQLQASGAVLRYVREGAGVPVILVQGVGVIAEGWRPQIDALRDRYAVAAADNRGIGGSTFSGGAQRRRHGGGRARHGRRRGIRPLPPRRPLDGRPDRAGGGAATAGAGDQPGAAVHVPPRPGRGAPHPRHRLDRPPDSDRHPRDATPRLHATGDAGPLPTHRTADARRRSGRRSADTISPTSRRS